MLKYPTEATHGREFIFPHSLRGYSLSWCEGVATDGEGLSRRWRLGWSHCIYSQEAESEQEVGPYCKALSLPIPSYAFPPSRLHLLKVPQPSETAPPADDQVCKCMSLWETEGHSNHQWPSSVTRAPDRLSSYVFWIFLMAFLITAVTVPDLTSLCTMAKWIVT